MKSKSIFYIIILLILAIVLYNSFTKRNIIEGHGGGGGGHGGGFGGHGVGFGGHGVGFGGHTGRWGGRGRALGALGLGGYGLYRGYGGYGGGDGGGYNYFDDYYYPYDYGNPVLVSSYSYF
jgi:hypothetical protein